MDFVTATVRWHRPRLETGPAAALVPAAPPRDAGETPPAPRAAPLPPPPALGPRPGRGKGGTVAAGAPTSEAAGADGAEGGAPAAAAAAAASSSPSARSRHAMCFAGGRMLLFGGSDESRERRADADDLPSEMDNAVFVLHEVGAGGGSSGEGGGSGGGCSDDGGAGAGGGEDTPPPLPPAEGGGDSPDDSGGGGGGGGGGDKKARGAAWVQEAAEVFDAGREPPIRWSPSTLLADLAGLVAEPLFADAAFRFEEDGAPGGAGGGSGGYDDGAPPGAPRVYGGTSSSSSEDEGGEGGGDRGEGGDGGGGGGGVLRAHRVLLGLRDGPLSAMLQSGMREGRSGEVCLHASVGRRAFTSVLAFLYTDALLCPVANDADAGGDEVRMVDAVVAQPDPGLVMETLFLAHGYLLARLVALCEGVLLRLVDPEANAASLLDFAALADLPQLRSAAHAHCFRSEAARAALAGSGGWAELAPAQRRALEAARTSTEHLYVGYVEGHALAPRVFGTPAMSPPP